MTRWNVYNTEASIWFERDRQYVELTHKATGRTIIDLWDEAVTEFVEGGFKRYRDSWHEALVTYANTMKLRAQRKAA